MTELHAKPGTRRDLLFPVFRLYFQALSPRTGNGQTLRFPELGRDKPRSAEASLLPVSVRL